MANSGNTPPAVSRAANQLTLASIALTATADRERNLEQAFRLIREAKKLGADWVQLPEMFTYMGPYEQIFAMAEEEGGPVMAAFAAMAKSLGIVLFAGTIGERPNPADPNHAALSSAGHRPVFNTAYVFGRAGETLAKYRKIHLFNLNGDDGSPRYCESDGYLPGRQPVSFTVDGLRVGLAICYDLRFPELFAALEIDNHPPDLFAVPSAFTRATGEAHWELLLRARAVERQAFVFAANQTGIHSPGKESFGHGMVIDPWGKVLASTGHAPGIALANIAPDTVTAVRRRLPALANRRLPRSHTNGL